MGAGLAVLRPRRPAPQPMCDTARKQRQQTATLRLHHPGVHMIRYVVADTHAPSRRIALRDPAGRLHLASVQYQVPDIGAIFSGSFPRPGFHALTSEAGDVFRVSFEQLNCSQAAVLEQLHGAAPALPAAVQKREGTTPTAGQRPNWAVL
jgi:hypothetical protein